MPGDRVNTCFLVRGGSGKATRPVGGASGRCRSRTVPPLRLRSVCRYLPTLVPVRHGIGFSVSQCGSNHPALPSPHGSGCITSGDGWKRKTGWARTTACHWFHADVQLCL